MYKGVIIKQVPTEGPRDLSATSRYMQKLLGEGHETPSAAFGPLTGSMNCASWDRSGQLQEIDHYLRLHGNLKSSQAASHQLISYPVGFVPTRAQVERDINVLLKKYGMEEHPVIWDAHTDTDNFHVHMLICRVSLGPGTDGKYPIANDGLVKKVCKENRREDRIRTDWAGCRQAAVAEIGAAYGWGQPQNVRMTPDGKPINRQDPKDPLGDKTRAGERKTGKRSKERQIAEVLKQLIDESIIEPKMSTQTFWNILDRKCSSNAFDLNINMRNGKATGAFVVGPDNRKCKFSNCGKGYSAPSLVKRFGPPTPADAAACNEYDLEPFEYRPNDLTAEEAKKRLLLVFQEAIQVKDWAPLIDGVEHLGMRAARSGGGLVIIYNDGRDTIKASALFNKFSLSRLEKVLGVCPLPKSAPAQPSKRDLLIQNVEPILSRHVRFGGSLSELRDALAHADITIEKKTFTNADGRRFPYFVLACGGISAPLSQIARTGANKPVYTLSQLERLDRAARHKAEVHGWLHRGQSLNEARYLQYLDNFIENARKHTARILPGVPTLHEINSQITKGYHYVSKLISGTKTHDLGHASEIGVPDPSDQNAASHGSGSGRQANALTQIG